MWFARLALATAIVCAGSASTWAHGLTTKPTVAGSCGTGPTIAGSDYQGKVTTGTGSPTSCTITFQKAFAIAPACFGNDETTAAAVKAISTTTTVILSSAAFVASDVLSYLCAGK